MKRAIFLALCLLIGGPGFLGGRTSAQSDDAFQYFWKKFKQAVISRDASTVAGLSEFPIGMSFPAAPINDRAELRRRFHEVFIDQVNAVKCFARPAPSVDTENPNLFTVACRNEKGNDAAVYQFARTKTGWRFTHFELSTTCGCR